MDGTSPGNMLIGLTGTGAGMQWWNPQTNQWQTEKPPLPTTCAANPPPNFFGHNTVVGEPLLTFPAEPAVNMFGEPTLPNYAACGCYVGAWWGVVPPPRCPAHEGTTAAPLTPFVAPQPQQFRFTPSLSDTDVERIARRVVELLATRGTP